ncbi:beta-lactamase/transpeptidase-like protein [Sporormia fimetaria CBS 119925]|uniref:Beta-lactamase/transpeptidase-like protein n=1 Tax=Sporormia fimetaria CBS 119925 TaxID=1340428 RepID=A0A6A6UX13_9PLEO|nr:beta-lactamase/transpeptidase-like protein [Sporormia fimetaria CBS 119925]
MSVRSDDPRITVALQRSLDLGETGIAVAAYYRGKLVVDAVAGSVLKDKSEPVTRETLFAIFSVTKGVTALAVHIQAERGLINVNDPISKYWPDFGTNGKESITVEDALCHRAGIPQMPPGVTPELMADWDWMVKHVAELKPLFPPGEANAYHVLVWGWIIGEVVRRTDPSKRPFETFVYEEICKPLGVTDFYLGVPDDKLDRVATLSGGNSFPMVDEHGISPPAVFPGADVHNTRVVQQCVDPGAGAVANASSVARIFALIAEGGELDGVRLLSKERVAGLTRPRKGAHDQDKVLPIPVWFGAAGYWLGGEPNVSDPLVGDHRDIIYSPGAGGSLAFADIRDRISVAICHNNMDTPMVMEPERTFAPVVKSVREIIADLKRGDDE